MNGFLFTVYILIVIWIIVSSILEDEYIVKKKDDLSMKKIKSKFLGGQVPLVIFINILLFIQFFIVGDGSFFEKYFWDNPILMEVLIFLLLILTFNSIYGLGFERLMIKEKENVNNWFITLPLWSFGLASLLVFIIMLLTISINPVEWVLAIKDFFSF